MWDEVYKAYKSKKHTAIKFQFADFFQYFGQVAHETIGDLNEAEKIYEEGLTLEPDHIGILTGLIDLYLEKVDVDVKNKTKAYWRAREVYNKAVGILKDLITKVQDTDYYRQLGELFLTMKEDEEAEKRLLSALERYGASAELLADLGVLYTRKGRFKVVSDYSDMQLVNYGKDDRILIQKCNKNTGRWESGYRFFRKSCGTALPFEMGDIL